MTADVVAACLSLPADGRRHLIAVAGPPASGKSTLAADLARELCEAGRRAQVIPMDGFHLGNDVLARRGLTERKGAPETFDLAGFASLLRRAASSEREDIAFPLFDRNRDLAEAGADVLDAEVDVVVVEGNYLLLNCPGWRDLHGLWSLSVFLDVAMAEIEARLTARWADLPPSEAKRRVHENDLPNARFVTEASRPADICLSI